MLEISEETQLAEMYPETSEYIRCEIYRTARHEMVVRLEDFLRRRSKIAQVVSHERLVSSEGLKEACEILFGEQARMRWEEYFQVDWETGLPLDEAEHSRASLTEDPKTIA